MSVSPFRRGVARRIFIEGERMLARLESVSAEAGGAYAMLIAPHGGGHRLPNDEAELARLLNVAVALWRRLRREIEPFFDLIDEYWYPAEDGVVEFY